MAEIVSAAFRDAITLIRSRIMVYGVFAGLCVLGGFWLPLIHGVGEQPALSLRLSAAIDMVSLLGGIASFFIFADAARTVRPEFKMTFLKVLGIIGIALAIIICVEIGLFLFVVPGVFLVVKWSQAIWVYLLDDGKNPFGESWQITTGQFWPTLGFLTLIWLANLIPFLFGFFLPAFIAGEVPIIGFLFLPIAFCGYTYAIAVTALAQLRWMLQLRAGHVAPAITAVVPA